MWNSWILIEYEINIIAEKLSNTALAVYVGLGINHRRCKNEIIAKAKITKKFLVLVVKIPIKYQPIKVKHNKIIENQLIWGNKLYKLETITPKNILGVADPLIMNSGFPV